MSNLRGRRYKVHRPRHGVHVTRSRASCGITGAHTRVAGSPGQLGKEAGRQEAAVRPNAAEP